MTLLKIIKVVNDDFGYFSFTLITCLIHIIFSVKFAFDSYELYKRQSIYRESEYFFIIFLKLECEKHIILFLKRVYILKMYASKKKKNKVINITLFFLQTLRC